MSREEFIASELEPLAQELDAMYETFEQEHEHERELAQAVEEATTPEGIAPVYYKIAIVILVLLLLVITGLWLGML